MSSLRRPEHWKLRECGGKQLSAIPSIMQALAPALSELPPVMASCDGIVYDSLSGEALKAVEAKHRCPFLPSSGQTFFFKGDRMTALEDVPLEYFSQCQLQMLVQDLPHCDLISYALPGSHIFTIPRDDQWLSLALRLLPHLQQKYIQADRVPEADMYTREVPQLFSVFTARTKHCMAELQRKPRLDVPSSIDRSACQIFLDDLPNSNQQRREAGGHTFLYCMHACMHAHDPTPGHSCLTRPSHAEELLGARPSEPARDMPAASSAAEPEEGAALLEEQSDDSQIPGDHEDGQAQSAVTPPARLQRSSSVSEQQPVAAKPARRPKRTLKRPQKILDGFQAAGQQVSCLT